MEIFLKKACFFKKYVVYYLGEKNTHALIWLCGAYVLSVGQAKNQGGGKTMEV